MIFTRVDPSSDYRLLRFLSSEGNWELGLSPYHNGTRLRLGLSGRPPSVIDLCMGHATHIYYPVLMAVMERLKEVRESASAREIDELFPWAGTRPDLNIHLEPLLKAFYLRGVGSEGIEPPTNSV